MKHNRKTSVEEIATALHVALKDIAPHAKITTSDIKAAITEHKNTSISIKEALGYVQSLFKTAGVEVSTHDWKYEIASPKLNPKVHLDAARKHEERLEKEQAYEIKRSLDPRLVQQIKPALKFVPPGM